MEDREDLYFLPLAGSLASRIALYEAGAEARYIEVDPNTKCTSDGTDFAEICPLALVPLLRLEDGSLLGENAAVLQYIANRYAEARLAPIDQIERARLQQWLSFTSTELHQGLFCQLFDQDAPEGTKVDALNKSKSRFNYLDDHLICLGFAICFLFCRHRTVRNMVHCLFLRMVHCLYVSALTCAGCSSSLNNSG